MKKILLLVIVLSSCAVVGCSVTSLQCGVDGDSSYVDLATTTKSISTTGRQMSELCGFTNQEKS